MHSYNLSTFVAFCVMAFLFTGCIGFLMKGHLQVINSGIVTTLPEIRKRATALFEGSGEQLKKVQVGSNQVLPDDTI